ncbi:methyltransferase domain-containing protein [Candidatus Nitrosacidococcus tergens]|uniref:Methyltransferase type 12 n=1 Tax=Candidatus Nitrosacidococcus tergens TaxID=553981 RepID=A0A7G1QBU3_9GAMM|nr:methyltransferase domain-containing protein [Candidatus Nitrosacidococcus tergens]CAB1276901.1 Methyltransferase type 12 [Candidatus Nitrosacidococcus tergens]
MYDQDLKRDLIRVTKAILTNQFARWAPRLYIKYTKQTGRGSSESSSHEVACYFQNCFIDYFNVLGISSDAIPAYLSGKHVFEYGPGDIPGVALLMVAHGAERVTCIDRFPMLSFSPQNIKIMNQLMADMSGEVLQRAKDCFLENGNPSSGFSSRIQYLVRPSGLSELHEEADLIISRAVLEHTNNLSASFTDMYQTLRKGGITIHEVDLKSHGLHRKNPLDFLTWPNYLWSCMYSYKGVPNRLRINHYRECIAATNFKTILIQPTSIANEQDVKSIRPYLAKSFQNISEEDLSWLSFWVVLEKV